MALAFSVPSEAASCQARDDIRIEGKPQRFCYRKESDSWVSPTCSESKSSPPCSALMLLARAKDFGKLAPEDIQGGRNPGTALCTMLGGKVVFGSLTNGSQITFCEAADHSLIDCNSLSSANAR